MPLFRTDGRHAHRTNSGEVTSRHSTVIVCESIFAQVARCETARYTSKGKLALE